MFPLKNENVLDFVQGLYGLNPVQLIGWWYPSPKLPVWIAAPQFTLPRSSPRFTSVWNASRRTAATCICTKAPAYLRARSAAMGCSLRSMQ